ncbi:MAG: hypothetical protein IKR14_06955 [Lachnospiraceae bacterium]|nr:hypothetical protein [Lachnospiraceae bacterium]
MTSWNNINVGSLFGTQSGIGGMLSDYNTIRSGSYKKLLKSYYGSAEKLSGTSTAKTSNVIDKILEEKRNPQVSAEQTKTNALLDSSVSNLKSSLGTLSKEKSYEDPAEVKSALKNFVTAYNGAIENSKKSTNHAISSNLAAAKEVVEEHADELKEIGISVSKDGKLTLDTKKLETLDTTKVKNLFDTKDALGFGSKLNSRISRASYYTTGSTTAAKNDTNTVLNETKTSAKDLKSSIDAVLAEDLFDKSGDVITSTVKDFIKNYNDTITSAKNSINSGVASNLNSLMSKTNANATELGTIGISVSYDGKLSMDEAKFGDSDSGIAKYVLQNYAKAIQTNASLVNFYASSQSNAATGYNASGAYSPSDLVSNMYNSIG